LARHKQPPPTRRLLYRYNGHRSGNELGDYSLCAHRNESIKPAPQLEHR
jgi:hypothetical protein